MEFGLQFNLPHQRFRDEQGNTINRPCSQCKNCLNGAIPQGAVLAQPGFQGVIDTHKIVYKLPLKNNSYLPIVNLKQ